MTTEPSISIPDIEITAREMSGAFDDIARILLENDIIDSRSSVVFSQISSSLRNKRDSKKWEVNIDRDNPIMFNQAKKVLNKTNDAIPTICCEKIAVNQLDSNNMPFDYFDIAVEIRDTNDKHVCRWHFDLANIKDDGSMQSGPLTHLQYGGHISGDRGNDHPLKVPRWCHPPLDVILLCEAITANFFPKEWDKLKENPSWCAAISLSQKLCYSAFLRKIIPQLSISNSTILNEMDASKWIK